jgi:hypothetical protein
MLNYNFNVRIRLQQKDTLKLNFDSESFHVIYTNGEWRDYDYVGLEDSAKELKS